MVLNSVGFWPFARSHALVNLQTNLNSTRYGKFAVPVPPLDEQQSIVKWVSGESRALNVAISGLEREIELLREYRIRLVADVVTGKLDVREAATRLPEDDQVDIPEEDADLIIDPEAVDEELAV
jgi:type I restriction enzyme S subunit